MIPTFFTTLALGTITSAVASIMALSSWVTGSVILQGNTFFDTTNNRNPSEYINTVQKVVWTGASLGYPTNGTQTGINLTVGNTTPTHTSLGAFQVDCTATGGNVKVSNGAKYDTCITRLPRTNSGVLTAVSLEFAGTPVGSVGYDCGFVKGLVSGTGTVIINNAVSASGSTTYVEARAFSGGLAPSGLWNSADYFKCGTLTNPGALSAKMKIWYYDTSAE